MMLLDHESEFVEVIEEYKTFLNQRFGLIVQEHQLSSLKSSIAQSCQKYSYSTPAELLASIRENNHADALNYLIKNIVVTESYFFRDEQQIQFLKTVFLPGLIEKRRQKDDKTLRIWSAGCSKGQEIYSVCILLHQLLPDFEAWNLQLVGTDICQYALADAKKACYNKWSIRTTLEFIYAGGYFQELADDLYQLKPFIQNKVKFHYLNLAEDSFPSILNGTFSLDLILCRNVFIYFDHETIKKTCQKFAQALAVDGILLLSATDPIMVPDNRLRLEKYDENFYLKRTDAFNDSILPEANSIVYEHSDHKLEIDRKKSLIDLKQDIIQFLNGAQWQKVIDCCQLAVQVYEHDAELLQFLAKAVLETGDLEKAKAAAEHSLRLNELDPHTYLLLGAILIQLGDYESAESAFRKTIFLNYDFVEAHYQLAQALLYQGRGQHAIKAFEKTLHLVKQMDPDRRIHNVLSLTYAGFAEILCHELAFYKKYLCKL